MKALLVILCCAVLSAGSTQAQLSITPAGSSVDLSAPGPIGETTPGSGLFSSLTSNSYVTAGYFRNIGDAYHLYGATGGAALFNGAETESITFNATSGLITGSGVLSIVSSGTNSNVKIQPTGTGALEIMNATSGSILLRSPDGTRYRITVANGGTISVSAAP